MRLWSRVAVISFILALAGISRFTQSDVPPDIILFAADARVSGAWQLVADTSAARGRAAVLPNAGRAKVVSPVANPSDFFTLTFTAQAGTAYHLWVRGRATSNAAVNDSVHVQFTEANGSSGEPIWEQWAEINLEDCSGCGNAGWGWEDNGWGSVSARGPHIVFDTDGMKTLRVQNREDGFFIDQVVLSPATYLTSAPGANKNDTTLLGEPAPTPSSATEIVMHARSAQVAGAWRLLSDAAAAGGFAAVLPNADRAKVVTPLANPADYFTIAFTAPKGTYHLWMRGRADGNLASNDSVHVHLSERTDTSGRPVWGQWAEVNLEDCSGCGNSGWGWEDNGWGSTGALGRDIVFDTDGAKMIRVQNREDGFFIDQIVLSPADYFRTSPGANKNDSTILAPTVASGTPPPPTPSITLVRAPNLMDVGETSAVIVWSTRENGAATARIDGRTINATTTRYAASTTGLSADYYQHEAAVSGLDPSTSYPYELSVGGVVVVTGRSFKTAPATGTGAARFIVFGDSGINSTAQRNLAARMTADTQWDVALHTGDLVYGTTSTTGDATYGTYHSWFFDVYRDWLSTRGFYPVVGNHDARATNGHGTAFFNLFVLPRNGATGAFPDHAERFYSFDYGPVHFVALDTELAFQDSTRRAAQLAWLADDLAGTPQPWKIVYFHRSPYSAGGEHGSDLAVRQAFGPVLERHGVQLALSSHEHTYERTIPVRTSTNTSHQAVTYIVSGGGGARLYPAASTWWTAHSASTYHYLRVSVNGCVMTTVAVNSSGGTFDPFTLDRCAQASDAGAPTVRITSPASGASLSGVVSVSVAATDDIRVEKVDLFVDGVWRMKKTAPYTFAWDSRTVAAGTHTLEARAYDVDGNVTRSTTVTVTTTGS
jgi:hypothetical protein